MKKKIFRSLLIVFGIMFALLTAACSPRPDPDQPESSAEQPAPNLVSISVDELPAVLYYDLNQEVSWQGIRIRARYDDASSNLIPYSDCEFSAVDMSTYGEKTVTVSYQGMEDSFQIYVMQNVTFTPGSATERTYLHENTGGLGGESDRFADGNAYFVYRFRAEEGQRFDAANVEMTIRNEYVVAVSFDNVEYTVIAQGATGADRVDFMDIAVDLNDFVDFTGNNGDLFLKFYDGVPADGYGCSLKNFSMHYLTQEKEKAPEPEPEAVSLSFTPAMESEIPYLFSQSGSGAIVEEGGHTRRWADNKANFVYKLSLGKEIVSASLALVLENQAKIECSFDGETWTTVADSIAENANGEGKFYANVTNRFTLPVTENEGVVYIRFSDADPSDGFGCCLHQFAIEAMVFPAEQEEVEISTVTFAGASEEEAQYLHAQSSSGTVAGEKRWADKKAYFVYKFTFGSEIKDAKLALKLENESKIEVSFDGETWTTVADSIAENANGEGKYYSNITNNFTVPVTENTGVMYIRFSDADTATGFGCALFEFSMTVTC